jgi:hypothetical protein
MTSIQTEADKANAEASRLENMGFFGQVKEGLSALGERGKQSTEEAKTTFFENKNVPNKPDEPIVGKSVPDIIESGKQFFRNVGGFFSKKVAQ